MFALDGLPKPEKKNVADHFAEMVGLKGFEQAFPYQVSGGMLKRVEVARALAVKSDILYMDEPFAALDALTRFRMRLELLRILTRENTRSFSSHTTLRRLYTSPTVFWLYPRGHPKSSRLSMSPFPIPATCRARKCYP